MLAARDRMIAALDDYRAFASWKMGMLAAARRNTSVDGLEQAGNFRKTLERELLLPELIDEGEVE